MNYNKMIDHTVLKADTPLETVKRICDEAMEYGFASVCINPCHVAYCADYLKDSNVNVCTVIGFPLGANTSAVKAFETKDASLFVAAHLTAILMSDMVTRSSAYFLIISLVAS